MSNQGRETSRPQLECSGSENDVPPPPAYEIVVTQSTSVEEERPSRSTGIESERPPLMPQSNAPIKDQPVRIEYRHPLDHIQDDPSRNTSNQTLPGSNATHMRVAQSAPAPQERGEEGGQLAMVAPTETIPPVRPVQPTPNGNVTNIFCCCSSRGTYCRVPGYAKKN
jgi:hypothetical protein